MALSFNKNTKNNDEWLTPPSMIKSLGCFDLDPCSPHPERRPWSTALKHYHKEMDGFNRAWHGRVWCNPPYGKETFKWVEKLSDHGNGIALIFARTETKGFHNSVWGKADAVFFFKGRIKFHYIDGRVGHNANAPSCLAIFGSNNIEKVRKSGLKGKLIILKEEEDDLSWL